MWRELVSLSVGCVKYLRSRNRLPILWGFAMATYPPDLEACVQQKIDSGEFRSRDELAIKAELAAELDAQGRPK